MVEVRVADGSATPRGKRVSVAVGEPVTFLITSDVAGELHAHSTPELSLDFEAGSSRHEITLTQPGVVDVELHDPELTIVQLEVR